MGEAEGKDAEAEDTLAADFEVERDAEAEDAPAADFEVAEVAEAEDEEGEVRGAFDLGVEREAEAEDAAGEDAAADDIDVEVDELGVDDILWALLVAFPLGFSEVVSTTVCSWVNAPKA